MRIHITLLAFTVFVSLGSHGLADPLGTAFSYQGQLTADANAANGDYDFKFVLYASREGGAGLATNIIRPLGVTNGYFTATLDFGAEAFDGTARWLEIAVKHYSTATIQAPHTVLTPRQPLTAVPYALVAERVASDTPQTFNGTVVFDPVKPAMPPFLVGSTNQVPALNAALLEGNPAAAFVRKAGDTMTGDLVVNAGEGGTAVTGISGASQGRGGVFYGGDYGATFQGGNFGIQVSSVGYAGQFNGNVRVEADYADAPGKPQLELQDSKTNGVSRLRFSLGSAFWDIASRTDTDGNALRFYSSAAGKDVFTISTNGSLSFKNFALTGGLNFNASPADLNVNGQRGFRVELTSSRPNVIGGSSANAVDTGVSGAGIVGGDANHTYAGSDNSVIAGGYKNSVFSREAAIGGGWNNAINSDAKESVIAGGRNNWIWTNSPQSAIGGGEANAIMRSADHSVIAGGNQNIVQSSVASIGGGYMNTNQSPASAIAGGWQNQIATNANNATIAGGAFNRVQPSYLGSAWNATIGGGQDNQVGADGGTIPGGVGNKVFGKYAFAAGHKANAYNDGSFVWSDATGADNIGDTGSNQFVVKAAGGMQLYGDTSLHLGAGWGQRFDISAFNGIGIQPGVMYFRSSMNAAQGNGFGWYVGGQHADGSYDPGKNGSMLMKLTYNADASNPCGDKFIEGGSAWLEVKGTIKSTAAVWAYCFNELCDRNAKTNFNPIDPRAVLDRVVEMPITEWNYTNGPTRHIGPMAQDFYGAFGVGPDNQHISTVDADGVALAAIQGLNQKLEDQVKAKDAKIEALERDVAELKSAVQLLLEKSNGGGQ